MVNFIKGFLKEEDGMGVIEIVIIIAVLVGLALIFRKQIVNFANNLMGQAFSTEGTENLRPNGGS